MKEAVQLFVITSMALYGNANASRLLVHSENRNRYDFPNQMTGAALPFSVRNFVLSARIDPSIDQLKAMVADQQSKMGALQQELAGLLNEVSSGKQAFQQCRLTADRTSQNSS